MSDLTPPRQRPSLELLAPAGNWECARSAVANGADAIYFGLQTFNARLRADNFTEADLPELMRFLHQHGVRGFVAMNTLVFTSELEAATAQLRVLEAAGVDAIIVQDLGLIRLAHAVAPRLEIHASTQMTLTSPEGLAFAQDALGLDRAVLARELSLRELKKFRAAEREASGPDAGAGAENPNQTTDAPVPLEVFVHGALCVAYSGQCLTSEALGQRSANRGECAQACRMPYQLIVDGAPRDLGDKRYLLSPQDLAAIGEIPELIALGVTSFKIEGRLKTPEYVAAVTRAYRWAIDDARGVAFQATRPGPASPDARRLEGDTTQYELEMAFSRGLFSGWMHGVNHQRLVHARFGKKRGALLGQVTRTGPDFVELRLLAPVAGGDGVVFENPANTEREMGGRVLRLERGRLYFDRRANVDPSRVAPGTRVYKTDDPRLNAELRATWASAGSDPGRLPLRLHVSGQRGQRLRIKAAAAAPDGATETAIVWSPMPLAEAKTRPLTTAVIRNQLSRLGGTPFHLSEVECLIAPDVMLPLSTLNQLRREIVEKLAAAIDTQRGTRTQKITERVAVLWPRDLRRENAAGGPSSSDDETPHSAFHTPHLSVLCRSMEQIETALALGVETIYADFEDIRRFKDAVALVRESRSTLPGRQHHVLLATPRIQKAGEEGYFKLIERAEPDGVLIRNLGAIRYFAGRPHLRRVGDFSLNVANPLTAEFFIQHGLPRLTISYDLNIGQVLGMVRAAPPEWFELTLHQHMPMFHMEHCVFAAFMSDGTDYTNCGRPCERHRVELRDRVGQTHPLLADVGCRNTLFRGQAQTGARFYRDLRTAGLSHFRVELLRENAAESRAIITAYQRLLCGADEGGALWQKLRATSQLGVTEGTLA